MVYENRNSLIHIWGKCLGLSGSLLNINRVEESGRGWGGWGWSSTRTSTMWPATLQTLRMRYPFQSTNRPISHRNVWSFRLHMIPLRDFIPEWNSRPGTTTGVNSRRGDSHRHDILRWYHVDKCRATGRNQIFGLKDEEEDLLTVIRRTNSLPRLQNTCRFAIAFIFSQPATARKNNSFLTRSCYLDFFYKNTMTGSSAVISNADFLHLKQATKFSTVNEALRLFFW